MRRRKFIRQTSLSTGAFLMVDSLFDLKKDKFPKKADKSYPFLWGSAYYRAPIPEPELWETDFQKMHAMDFNSVKFLMQWRWSHIGEDQFYFDDFKKLLDLAHKYQIKVTINHLLDVSPHWLYDKYPDAKQVMNNGHVIQPYAVGHRHIGGHPGPCYNHPGAKKERIKFLSAAVRELKKYPALDMWDVWNEPELSYPQRSPIDVEKLVCYCHNCENFFKDFLKNKYHSLENLNNRWGRNYPDWQHVEMPRSANSYLDFIDWREFHAQTITREAAWRIKLVKEQDPDRTVFLHVVPNTMNPFNAVSTCTDDFAVAQLGDVFAATMNAGPLFTPQVVSAGQGKICYNVENHLNGGSTGLHQKIIDLPTMLRDLIPQLGLGIKGFVFWQFRPEILGAESPAWGLVNLDGTDREVTRSANEFWKRLQPHTPSLMKTNPPAAAIGIWKSRKNEIFHFGVHNNLTNLFENVTGYANALYWNSYAYRYVSGDMLENNDLQGIRLLIMPSAYYLTQAEADALGKWVNSGGVLLAEAHLGGYNGTTGRHSRRMPGCGLSEAFGIKEELTTASVHLPLEKAEALTGEVSGDLKKALDALGITGGKYYPIQQPSGKTIWGAFRYAELSGDHLTEEGWFEKQKVCAASKVIGKGFLYYYATNLGSGSTKNSDGLIELLDRAAKKAGIERTLNASATENNALRTDILTSNGEIKFITLQSNTDKKLAVTLSGTGEFTGLFTGLNLKLKNETRLELPAHFTDIFTRDL